MSDKNDHGNTKRENSVLDRRNLKEAQLELLQRELSTVDINLKAASNQLDTIMKSLAAGIDPPAVEQQIEQNSMMQNYKSIADNAKSQYDGIRDKLGDMHPIVLQAKAQWDRQVQKVTDYEAETRTKVRNLIKCFWVHALRELFDLSL